MNELKAKAESYTTQQIADALVILAAKPATTSAEELVINVMIGVYIDRLIAGGVDAEQAADQAERLISL